MTAATAERHEDKSQMVLSLQPPALYALSASEAEVRVQGEKLIAAGEVVTTALALSK